jgi:hypothetical protein
MQNNTNFSSLQLMQQQDPYQKMMEMRTNMTYNTYRTVFNDISDE